MASRKRAGKLAKVTPQEKKAKAERNARRKRSPKAVRWAKEHVVHESSVQQLAKAVARRKSKRQLFAESVAEQMKKLPAVEDAKVGRQRVVVQPVGRRGGDR